MTERLPTVPNLLAAHRDYLALPDATHVLFALAVAVASRFEGDPLWGLLVAAPSSGKTETLRGLDDVADEHLDELTVAGLLSWSKARGKQGPKKQGLLARNPGRIFATVGDLSTLLSMSDRGTRDMLYSLLRRAYDGRVHRDIDGPGPLTWEGRLTLLAAATPTVDSYASHADALGPRWLYLRLPTVGTEQRRAASRKAREGGLTLGEHRERVRGLATAIVDDAAARAAHVDVGELLGEQLDDAALVACLGRASVPRDGYGRREILAMPVIEEPPRIAGQLDKLARGFLALGLDEKAAGAVCRRAALDSMPRERLACLDALAGGQELSQAAIARLSGAHRHVVRRTLEDLQAIGVCTYEGADTDDDDRRGPWRLEGPDTPLVRAVLKARRTWHEKCVTHPHSPSNEREQPTFRATPAESQP